MNPWITKAVILAAGVVMVVIAGSRRAQ